MKDECQPKPAKIGFPLSEQPKMKDSIPLAFLLFSLAAGTASADGVYKWVDGNGQAHFASTPPTGKKADKLNIQAAPADSAAPAGARTWQDQLQLSNQRRQLAREKEQEAAKRRYEDEQRCQSAQRNLDTLNRSRPIYSVNDQGAREYLEDGQRQAAREAASQRIATYCRN